MNGALNLHDAFALRRGEARREVHGLASGVAPRAVRRGPLAGLVPALDEVVVDVARGRSADLDIHVVELVIADAVGRHEVAPRGQVDPADECDLRLASGIDQPALLMLAVAGLCPVPAGPEARAARSQHVAVGRGAREGQSIAADLGVRAPEDDAHVQPACDRAVQQIEQGAAPVRHAESGRQESDRHPDALPRRLDRLADASEGGHDAHERTHRVSCPHGIRAGGRKGDMRLDGTRGQPGVMHAHPRCLGADDSRA
jgi:hypothetical protein